MPLLVPTTRRANERAAAAVDGNFVYVASESIEQGLCTLEQFITGGFTCSGKRTSLANWSTRIAKLKP